MQRDLIVNFCRDYLSVEKFHDYCLNGLQIEGASEVSKIITGVSWSQKLVQHAIDVKAEMILVHHGLFPNMLGTMPDVSIINFVKERVKQLLVHDINLMGFHLPLDAHPEIGNNVSICRVLGLRELKPLDIGFIGTLPRVMTLKEFTSLVAQEFVTKPRIVSAKPERVSKVAVISGGASSYYKEVIAAQADTFLCGDLREDVVWAAEEAGVNVIDAGHYNTEKLGIKQLGELVAKHFGLEVEFFDVPCEI